MEIINNYFVNKKTMALIPGKNIDYETIVYEEDRKILVRQSISSIIKESCIHIGYTTYEGRIAATKELTNFKKKIPILISEEKRICIFYTHSLQHLDNHCFSSKHITKITTASEKNTAMITFINGEKIKVSSSTYTIKSQKERADELISIMGMDPYMRRELVLLRKGKR